MKIIRIISAVVFLNFSLNSFGQENGDKIYEKAMNLYKKREYVKSSIEFDRLYQTDSLNLSTAKLYDGVCIYALSANSEKAFQILEFLVFKKYYSNLKHITTDADLKDLHSKPEWQKIIDGVDENLKTLPERTKSIVKESLSNAKKILTDDGGKLWGEKIWSDNILVLANDNTVYGLSPFPESKTDDSVIYYNKFPENTFSFSNSAQDYKGKKYAVIMTSYLSDSSSTIIHELFHILQLNHRNFNGNPLNYLDNYDAREWLRLEYQALRNCLDAIDKKQSKSKILTYFNDAFIYRKVRQLKYKEWLSDETEIETLEGLANYTGFLLSTYPNKYQRAIKEIYGRENANTYTRTFPYATGLAYGLIFDYLNLDWKKGVDSVYNFLEIYETKYLKHKLNSNKAKISSANKRNNFIRINEEEAERKKNAERVLLKFRKKLVDEPTLSVNLKEGPFGRTYDMNGTFVLKDFGIIYTSITGTSDSSGNNFGNFKTFPERDKDNISGILASFDNMKFTFPLPFKIEGNKIIGETYEIELNNNWIIRKKNDKGDFELIEKPK